LGDEDVSRLAVRLGKSWGKAKRAGKSQRDKGIQTYPNEV
jgi:hypothetical protein